MLTEPSHFYKQNQVVACQPAVNPVRALMQNHLIYLHTFVKIIVSIYVSGYDEDMAQTNEIIFLVEEAPEGGFTARALGESIFTEADTEEELQIKVRDAVKCHFDPGQEPKIIRLHHVREEVLAL